MIVLKIAELITHSEAALGVRRIAPVWGSKLRADEYHQLVLSGQEKGMDLLTPGEVGCTLAHMSAYEYVVDIGQGALILEEDIVLDPALLQKVESRVDDTIDFINFCIFERFRPRGTLSHQGLWKIDHRHDFWMAAAYYVSVSCAKRLLEFHRSTLRRADDWAGFFLENPAIVPFFSPVFVHSVGASHIESERRRHRPMNARALVRRRMKQYLARHGVFFPRLAPPIPVPGREGDQG